MGNTLGRQVLWKQALLGRSNRGTRQTTVAPIKGIQGPGHRHTNARPSLCAHPPKEGGSRVVAGRTGRAMALVGGLPQTADQGGALAKAGSDREESARQCVGGKWEGGTGVHTTGRGGCVRSIN